MPFAGYKDFEDCVKKNQDKKNPEGYCAAIQRKVEGKQASELLMYSFVKPEADLKNKNVIYSEPSNTDLDLHGDYMTEQFIDKMVETINNSPKGLPQFNGHGSLFNEKTIFDMLARTIRAEKIVESKDGNSRAKLRVYSKLNEKHKDYNNLIYLLENDFPVQQSIVVANPKTKKEFNKELDSNVFAVVDGKLKAIDFVGIGANESTSVYLAKGLNSGFIIKEVNEMSEETKQEPQKVEGQEKNDKENEKKEGEKQEQEPKTEEKPSEEKNEETEKQFEQLLQKSQDLKLKEFEKKLDELFEKQLSKLEAKQQSMVEKTDKPELETVLGKSIIKE